WLCGLEPPSNWRLRGSAKPSAAASSANPDQSGREILTQLHKEAASKEKKAANRYAEKTAIDFAIAVDRAQDQKYSEAIEALENLNAKLKAPGRGLDSLTLADKLDRLLTAREEAEKQAALLPAERQRAADAGKAAEAALVRATVLEDKLRAAETNLRKSESKV